MFLTNGSAMMPAIEATKKKNPAPIIIVAIGTIAKSPNILYPLVSVNSIIYFLCFNIKRLKCRYNVRDD